MKKDIHPKYYPLELIFTDGTKFNTFSTTNIGKIILDADIKTHSAWTGSLNAQINQKAGKVASFNAKFGDLLNIGSGSKSE